MKNLLQSIIVLFLFFFLFSCSLFQSFTQKTYYWQEGDSLEKVAKEFGDDVLEIRIRNHIYEPEDLFEGFPLIIIPQKKVLSTPKANSQKFRFSLPSKGNITSRYGKRNGRFHYGVDFGADKTKEIIAVESGIIKRVGFRSGYGNTIEIAHSRNIRTLYAHLEKSFVKTGQKVRKGELIAIMGNTGRSTGVHLHFEVIVNGNNIDPLKVLPQ